MVDMAMEDMVAMGATGMERDLLKLKLRLMLSQDTTPEVMDMEVMVAMDVATMARGKLAMVVMGMVVMVAMDVATMARGKLAMVVMDMVVMVAMDVATMARG